MIAINGRFLTQPITGVQRYAIELVHAMDAMLAEGELERPADGVEILAPPGAQLDRPLRFMTLRRVGWGSGQVWEQFVLPSFSMGKLLFTPCGGSPILHRRHVFTIPDAGVFATRAAYSPLYSLWYRLHHRAAVSNAGLSLLTVSEFSKSELTRWLKIDARRIQVTPEGHEHALAPISDVSVLTRLELVPHTYVLGVGSANPNKNFATLLKAFSQLQNILPPEVAKRCRLVLVGSSNSRIFGETGEAGPAIMQTGYLKDGELRSLYENAACFVFPSTYEGFGLPPLEAMSLGCPVVSSNASSLPEVCGDAALYADPLDATAIAAAIVSLLTDEPLRQEMIRRGKLCREHFRWRDTARLTWTALLQARASGRSVGPRERWEG